MLTYRCTNPHPSRPGQPCNKKLFEADFQGQIGLRCDRCHEYVNVDTRDVYTSSTAVTVDKVFARV
jgi:phage FluMu protein Com